MLVILRVLLLLLYLTNIACHAIDGVDNTKLATLSTPRLPHRRLCRLFGVLLPPSSSSSHCCYCYCSPTEWVGGYVVVVVVMICLFAAAVVCVHTVGRRSVLVFIAFVELLGNTSVASAMTKWFVAAITCTFVAVLILVSALVYWCVIHGAFFAALRAGNWSGRTPLSGFDNSWKSKRFISFKLLRFFKRVIRNYSDCANLAAATM